MLAQVLEAQMLKYYLDQQIREYLTIYNGDLGLKIINFDPHI